MYITFTIKAKDAADNQSQPVAAINVRTSGNTGGRTFTNDAATGTWTLRMGDAGVLKGWSVTVCLTRSTRSRSNRART